ncbi:MAG: hypothetical protein KGL39_14030 [Patescibacteria group bacterium]|nr:hypothetical protein [Patescibacteria group bacterium]
MISLTLHTDRDVAEARRRLCEIPAASLPLVLTLKKYRKHHTQAQLDMLGAHFRDIARWRYGKMTVPQRIYEQVVDDFRESKIWPSYSEPEPDVFTGEILYRKKSRRDLSGDEIKGIVQWLEAFMIERGIVSHAPVDNWQT